MSAVELDRGQVSFAQAEGRESLPTQLRTQEISSELRSYLWKAIYESIEGSVDFPLRVYPKRFYLITPWFDILSDWWVNKLHKFVDEFDESFDGWVSRLKTKIASHDYIEIFDFIQFSLRHPYCPPDYSSAVENALVKGRAAYRIYEQTVFPISSELDALVVESAFKSADELGLQGTRVHLRDAGACLTQGDWAGSVRESIHAVEAALKAIEPNAPTLSSALVRLEKDGRLNPNLKRSMNALYDFTSDENGIRHAKVLEDVNVGEAEAMYMLGACSAFITFVQLRLSA